MFSIQFNKQHTSLLKIYLALTVTAFHILRFVYNAPIMSSYGVVGFFIISGYGCYFSLGSKTFKNFIKNRLSYIVLPYYISLLFYTIAHFGFGFYGGNTTPLNRSIWGIVTHLLFIHNVTAYTQWTISGVLWFIAPMMQLYFLSPLLRKITNINNYLSTIVIGLIFIASCIVNYFYNITNLSFWGGFHIIYIAPFLLGMVLAKHNNMLLSTVSLILNKLPVLIIYFILVLILTYYTLYSKDIATITIIVLISLPGLLFIGNQVDKIIPKKITSFLGEFSFYIYLYNYAFIVFLPILQIQSNALKTIIYFLVVTTNAYFFYYVTKQVDNLFKRVFR